MAAAIVAMPPLLHTAFGGQHDAIHSLLDVGTKGPARGRLQIAALPYLQGLFHATKVAMPQWL